MEVFHEFKATGSIQEITLPPNVYRFDCWGANGGSTSNSKGGFGSYVSGIIKIRTTKTFYVAVGKSGTQNGQKSYNGGGSAPQNGASGGGATDIRLLQNEDFQGLKSRIIVAAGGGGAESYQNGAVGGNGGILQGEDGKLTTTDRFNSLNTGGTQISGGKKGISDSSNGTVGIFGSGGNGALIYGGGGGGGYFGGGGGLNGVDITSSGAGGSSYVSGLKGCKSVQKDATNEQSPEMNDSPIHYSGLVFRHIAVKTGVSSPFNDGYVIIYRTFDLFFTDLPPRRFHCKFFVFILIFSS